MEPLEMECDSNDRDFCRLFAGEDPVGDPYVSLTTADVGEACSVVLRKEKARRMRDWLTEWLTKHGS
jgi:hypothetical protein